MLSSFFNTSQISAVAAAAVARKARINIVNQISLGYNSSSTRKVQFPIRFYNSQAVEKAIHTKSVEMGQQYQTGTSTNTSNDLNSTPLNGKNVLLTGSTGFVGSWILYSLLKNCPDVGKVLLEVRGNSANLRKERIQVLKNNRPFLSDVDEEFWLNKVELFDKEKHSPVVDGILNCSGNTDWVGDIETLHKDNVESSSRLLESIPSTSPLVHCSTVLAGPKTSSEYKLYPSSINCDPKNQKFVNNYGLAKAMAEAHFENDSLLHSQRPTTFIRPSGVSGVMVDEKYRGWSTNHTSYNGLFLLNQALPKGSKLPIIGSAGVSLTPVDILGNAFVAALCERLATAISTAKDNDDTNNLISLPQCMYYNCLPKDQNSDMTFDMLADIIGKKGDHVTSKEEFVKSSQHYPKSLQEKMLILGHFGLINKNWIGNMDELEKRSKLLFPQMKNCIVNYPSNLDWKKYTTDYYQYSMKNVIAVYLKDRSASKKTKEQRIKTTRSREEVGRGGLTLV